MPVGQVVGRMTEEKATAEVMYEFIDEFVRDRRSPPGNARRRPEVSLSRRDGDPAAPYQLSRELPRGPVRMAADASSDSGLSQP